MCSFNNFGFTPPTITFGVLLDLDLIPTSLRNGVDDALRLLVGLLRTEESSRFVSTVAGSLCLSDGALHSVRCWISSVISIIEHKISLDCKISLSMYAILLTSNNCSSSSDNKVSLLSSCPRMTLSRLYPLSVISSASSIVLASLISLKTTSQFPLRQAFSHSKSVAIYPVVCESFLGACSHPAPRNSHLLAQLVPHVGCHVINNICHFLRVIIN